MRIMIVFIILFQTIAYTQENPWKTKKGENPWKNYPTNKTVKIDTIQRISTTDTLVNISEKTDSTDLAINAEKSDEEITTIANQNQLLKQAENNAKKEYKIGGDIATGFLAGLVLNIYGLPIGVGTSFISTKKEKAIITKTIETKTVNSTTKKKLKSRTKAAIRKKRIGATITGVMLGITTQIAIILAISSN